MGNTKGTAQNAKMIEIQMKAAAAYLEEAVKAIRIAENAIDTGEDGVAVLERHLRFAVNSANSIAERWTGIRMDREKQ